jgi:hypothetical protein
VRGNAVVRHCATSQKVMGSIPDGAIEFFSVDLNPSSHTMVLGSTHPLTEMSTRNLPGGKRWLSLKADNLIAKCELNV